MHDKPVTNNNVGASLPLTRSLRKSYRCACEQFDFKKHFKEPVRSKILTMLCVACSDLCADFDLDEAKRNGSLPHHPNYAALVISAKNGCPICIEIRRQRESKVLSHTDDSYREFGNQIRCVFKEWELGLYWIQADLETPCIAYMDVCAAAGKLKFLSSDTRIPTEQRSKRACRGPSS